MNNVIKQEKEGFEFELHREDGGDYICITDKKQPWQDPAIVPIAQAEEFIKSFSRLAYKARTQGAC